jgi:hypothetical protein
MTNRERKGRSSHGGGAMVLRGKKISIGYVGHIRQCERDGRTWPRQQSFHLETTYVPH